MLWSYWAHLRCALYQCICFLADRSAFYMSGPPADLISFVNWLVYEGVWLAHRWNHPESFQIVLAKGFSNYTKMILYWILLYPVDKINESVPWAAHSSTIWQKIPCCLGNMWLTSLELLSSEWKSSIPSSPLIWNLATDSIRETWKLQQPLLTPVHSLLGH